MNLNPAASHFNRRINRDVSNYSHPCHPKFRLLERFPYPITAEKSGDLLARTASENSDNRISLALDTLVHYRHLFVYEMTTPAMAFTRLCDLEYHQTGDIKKASHLKDTHFISYYICGEICNRLIKIDQGL
jgi:hypothetical protein